MGCANAKGARITEFSAPQEMVESDVIAPKAAPCDFHHEYMLGEKLGSGAFGLVYSARKGVNGKDVAVKVVDAHKESLDGGRTDAVDKTRQRVIELEVAILRILPRSANVITFFDVYAGEGLAYLVMEKCSMGLLAYLHNMPVLTEAALKPAFEDMLNGIGACHSAGIVHRDIKCDNFLVAPRFSGPGHVVKLCDFGCAARAHARDPGALAGVCGTAPYMAPEMLRRERYGAGVDVWAMGTLVHVLIFGAWPYMPAALSAPDVRLAIVVNHPAPTFRSGPSLPEVSADCAVWVKSLLCRDPARRPSAKHALAAKSFKAEWSRTAPLTRTLCAAVRCGAFERPGRAFAAKNGLDEMLGRLNARYHGVSEVSTDASLDEPSQPGRR